MVCRIRTICVLGYNRSTRDAIATTILQIDAVDAQTESVPQREPFTGSVL